MKICPMKAIWHHWPHEDDLSDNHMVIKEHSCIGCGLCAEVCAFNAIELEEIEGKGYRAKNIPASCKGCGICAASCPQLTIDMLHFRNRQIVEAVCAAI